MPISRSKAARKADLKPQSAINASLQQVAPHLFASPVEEEEDQLTPDQRMMLYRRRERSVMIAVTGRWEPMPTPAPNCANLNYFDEVFDFAATACGYRSYKIAAPGTLEQTISPDIKKRWSMEYAEPHRISTRNDIYDRDKNPYGQRPVEEAIRECQEYDRYLQKRDDHKRRNRPRYEMGDFENDKEPA